MDANEIYTVKDVASFYGRSEETIKRWLREDEKKNELFPNAFKNSDKEGWKIPKRDLVNLQSAVEPTHESHSHLEFQQAIFQNEKEITRLAYKAVTLMEPPKPLDEILADAGIKKTLEALLIMRLSKKPVTNIAGFVRSAVQQGWTATTDPKKIERKKTVSSKPSKRETLPEWFYENEEVKQQPKDAEVSTDKLIQQFNSLKKLSQFGDKTALDRLGSIQKELEKRGVSM